MKRAALAAQVLLGGCASVLLGACASFPPNPPLAQYVPKSGYGFELFAAAPEDRRDELMVVVSFSGGGTRAAALAYGVLEALRDTTLQWQGGTVRLLDEVDVISSVSGGSFTAAYYALRGEAAFTEFPERFLYRDVQGALIGEMLSPASWPKLAGASYGRSDLAAEFYHRELFGQATYAALIAAKRRPFVILNATDMSTGTPFAFIQDQFDLMCSDLAGVPLARAVAASSAFPGALTPLTFQNYAGRCGYVQPPWVRNAANDHASRENPRRSARAENRLSLAATVADAQTGAAVPVRPYLHLTDGGVADNLGLREPINALTSNNHPWSLVRMMNNGPMKKLVIVAVNAATGASLARDQSAEVPGLFDTVFTAADVPLSNYSFDTVELLGKAVDDQVRDARLVDTCNRRSAEKGAQCALNLPSARRIDFYPVQVAFEYIASPEERDWFRKLETNFALKRGEVDRLTAMGRRLLLEDPHFQRLMKDLGGTISAPGIAPAPR